MTISMLVRVRERPLQLTDQEQKIGEDILPKLQNLLRNFTRIALQNGWDEDDEDDYDDRTIEGQRCMVAYDGNAYRVSLPFDADRVLSRDQDKQKAIQLATEVLQRAN